MTVSVDISPRGLGATAKIWPVPAIAALAACATVLFAPQVLNDGDTFWHLATGAWIVEHGAIPVTDPFSAAVAGSPWVAHEWLSELVMAAAFRSGGWDGLVGLFAGAVGLSFFLLGHQLRRWLNPEPTAIALLLAAACVSPGLLARPHILVLPVMVAWAAGLVVAAEAGRVPWRLLPLVPLWANLHGSVLFGLALACPFALEAGWPAVRRWAPFLAAAILLAMATPQGWHGLAFPFQLMSMAQLASIEEWRGLDFSTVQPIEAAIMALLYLGLARGVRVPPLRLLIVLALFHLALRHGRHQLLAGAVGPLVLAEPLGRAFGAAAARRQPWRHAAITTIVLAMGLGGVRLLQPIERGDGASAPISAVAQVPIAMAAQPVLNDYNFGGYLIFLGLHPFVDGRTDLYGDAFLADYAAMMGPDQARLRRTLDQRSIGWTLLTPGSAATAAMDGLHGWHRLYADAVAVVHARAIP